MAYPVTTCCGREDLDWLRAELGIAHLELELTDYRLGGAGLYVRDGGSR